MTNYYEILGVSRTAEAAEISLAYRRLLVQLYQEMGKEADLASLSLAHKILTNPAKRRDYDARLALLSGQFAVQDPEKPTKAEKAFLDGLKAFDLQNYQEAVQYFARAARLDPKNGHFFSQWGLSIGMFPGRLPEAELYCKKAIELDPDNPVFYFNLGFLYQRHNLGDSAQQSFAKAQEAQQVRQAKYSAQDSAAIAASWRGDAASFLKELDSIEQTIGWAGGEQDSVIALPLDEAPVPEGSVSDQAVPAGETTAEQTPAPGGEVGDLGGVSDLLSELDSLESSIERVETYRNGQTPPEESPLEIIGVQEGQVPPDRTEKPPSAPDTAAPLPIVTIQEELSPEPSKAGGMNEDPGKEYEGLEDSPLDLLKELDSIESMVAGIEQAGKADRLEPASELSIQPQEASHRPGPPEKAEPEIPEPSSKELEDQALKLLQELDLPPAPEETDLVKSASETEVLAIKQKMEKLNQMEEQMMEELLKLKAERERLKEDLKV